MKLLLYGLNYWPEKTGVGKYTGEMAEWLAAKGHEVKIVTTAPYYPAWRIEEGYSGARFSRETHAGVEIFRCPLWVPPKPTGLTRLLHLGSFGLSSLAGLVHLMARWRPDVLIQMAPTLLCSPGAILLSRLFRVPTWLHIQDFEIDAAFSLDILSSAVVRKLALSAEKLLLKRFRKVSTITPRMLEKLSGKGVAPGKTFLFSNWADTRQIHPLGEPSRFRKFLNLPANAVVALYAGTMGGKQGLEILIEVANILQDQNELHFVFSGEGGMRERLKTLSQNLPRVHFLPMQPLEELNELLNLADLHLLPQKAGVADLVMPSKLTGMLASGRPVVATAAAGTQVFQVVSKCGVCTPPGDARLFSRGIMELVRDRKKRHVLGMAGREYAEDQWSKEKILANFEAGLYDALGVKSSERIRTGLTR